MPMDEVRNYPPLAVTMGDPAGIGADIAISAWNISLTQKVPVFFAIGDPQVFRSRAVLLGLPQDSIIEITAIDETFLNFSAGLPVLATTARCYHDPARAAPDANYSRAIIESIETAVALALSGQASAIVTCPIAKHILMSHGFIHAGHTEFLGELAKRHGHDNSYPVMLMASPRLNVVPVTVHVPLRAIPDLLTSSLIVRAAEAVADDFPRYFGISSPRMTICGLNPHAGENGELGREEIDVIAPAVEELRARGLTVSGPHSADTLFHEAARAKYDVVLAMYHDQALIPFKTLSFEDGVNVTLGLPFIRTSPDHGTAFSLAGTGRASPSSFIAALKLAQQMYDHKQKAGEPLRR